jgi:hypothetical protein
MTEKELRKQLRSEVKGIISEENAITNLLGKILNGMSSAAKKRALKKMINTPELVALMKSSDNPRTNDYIDRINNL